jgi:hypothetical protein
MTFINTDGLSLLGPGSEWFWTAVSAVAVVVTLYAIYRQLLIQQSLKEVQQFDDLSREWNSERFIRLRLVVAKALRDGGKLDGVGAATRLGDWWDNVAGLVRAGHLGRAQILRQWSPMILVYWTMLGPLAEDDWDNFGWLANQVLRGEESYTRQLTPLDAERVGNWIASLEGELALEEALRGTHAAQ